VGANVGSSVGAYVSSSEELLLLLLLSLIYVGAMVGDGVALELLAALDPRTMMDIAISWQRRVSFIMVRFFVVSGYELG